MSDVADSDGLERLWSPHRMAYIRGEHQSADTGILDFMRNLPGEILKRGDLQFVTPAEAGKLLNRALDGEVFFGPAVRHVCNRMRAARSTEDKVAVAAAFDRFAVAEPERFRRIDATQPPETVTAALLAGLTDLLP